MRYDVIIIGSGLGGLECARLLAEEGMSVLVLERGNRIGGCLQSYPRDGLSLDTGFHYVGGLGEGQSLYPAFKRLGLMELPWQRLDPYFDRITIGDRSFAFAQGFEAFVDTLAAEFPGRRRTLTKFATLLKEAGERQFEALNPQNDDASASFLDSIEINAYQYLTELFQDPLLVNVISGTSLKMELRKESLPLFTFLHGNSGFIESSWRLKGDGSLIAKTLERGIREQGGEIIRKAEVIELVEQGGTLTRAICSNGESYEGKFFISDIHPVLTCGLVKQSDRIKKVYRDRIARLENTFGMFTVSLCLRPGALRYFNWNQYVYTDTDVWSFYQDHTENAGGLLISCRVPEDGSKYTRQIDLLTPMPWSRCLRWEHTRVGRRGEEYEAMKRRWATSCILLAERVIPGLRDSISTYYTSTPLTYRDYTATPEGSAYGARKNCEQPLTTLLSTRTPIPNLLLTGQSLMLHGLHGVTMTAFHTCAEVLGKKRVWEMIKN